jgi:hypothetical protein
VDLRVDDRHRILPHIFSTSDRTTDERGPAQLAAIPSSLYRRCRSIIGSFDHSPPSAIAIATRTGRSNLFTCSIHSAVFENMRRLDAGGQAPGKPPVVVDVEGATLGPGCVLLRRAATGYRCLGRDEAAAIQKGEWCWPRSANMIVRSRLFTLAYKQSDAAPPEAGF